VRTYKVETEDLAEKVHKKDKESRCEILKLPGNWVIQVFIRKFEFILKCYQKGAYTYSQ